MQEEYFGFNSIEQLKSIILKHSVNNIFLIADKQSYQLSGAEKILNRLLRDYKITYFNDFSENPKIEDIEKGIALFKAQKYDLVIAIGGGSVIDTAKLINILSAQDGSLRNYVAGLNVISKKGSLFVVIPTTAGSGSEATHFAVVYINKTKFSLVHEYILPEIVIIDPQFSMSLPPYITAASGMDAFCQAVESYWSVNSTEESKTYSKEAIRLILESLVKVVNDPSAQARFNMAKAAFLAGKAINITKTTAPHALSYPITTYFGVSHGHAVGLTLGEMFVYNYWVSGSDIADKRGVEYVKKSIQELNSMLSCEDAMQSKERVRTLMKDAGLKVSLSDLNIKSTDDRDLIIKNVDIERLQNNPRLVTKEALKQILAKI